MKRKLTAILLAGVMAISVCSCGEAASEKADQEKTAKQSETEITLKPEMQAEDGEVESSQAEAAQETAQTAGEAFDFAELKRLEFWFSSGAGGWATLLYVNEDGSFYGEYFDGEMGAIGDDYPSGTMYRCDFKGQFTQPVKVNDYTYSMQIREMFYEKEAGTEEIIDGVKYCYSDVYGLEDAEDILIYLPGAPLEELPEDFRSWIGYYDLEQAQEKQLPFYALNNEVYQNGFVGNDIVENLKDNMKFVEMLSADVEQSIEEEALTQLEYNEKSKELYDLWDGALNDVWNVLKRTKDEETMKTLTAEEREWIALKDKAAAEAGAEYEGGSMQSMIVNLKAAELTKERVYELLEMVEG